MEDTCTAEAVTTQIRVTDIDDVPCAVVVDTVHHCTDSDEHSVHHADGIGWL